MYEELGKWDGRPDDLKEFSGWNVGNKNFFSSDFLDPYFYTLLKSSEDSPELRNLGKSIFYDQNLMVTENELCDLPSSGKCFYRSKGKITK